MAGGGTLITFPTLIWLGLNPVIANATNTVAVWPGTVGSIWGYRRELRTAPPRLFRLVAPSLAGGLLGAWLLRFTPVAVFSRLVPFLILFATLLFMAQEPVQRRLKTADAATHQSPRWLAGALLFQLAVAVYGGYFGAAIGLPMLAALSIIGLTNMHQMNALKVLLGGSINGIAVAYFIVNKMVYWPDVLVMAVGAIVGGVGGAGFARRLGGNAVRRIVIVIGWLLAVSFFIRR